MVVEGHLDYVHSLWQAAKRYVVHAARVALPLDQVAIQPVDCHDCIALHRKAYAVRGLDSAAVRDFHLRNGWGCAAAAREGGGAASGPPAIVRSIGDWGRHYYRRRRRRSQSRSRACVVSCVFLCAGEYVVGRRRR